MWHATCMALIKVLCFITFKLFISPTNYMLVCVLILQMRKLNKIRRSLAEAFLCDNKSLFNYRPPLHAANLIFFQYYVGYPEDRNEVAYRTWLLHLKYTHFQSREKKLNN